MAEGVDSKYLIFVSDSVYRISPYRTWGRGETVAMGIVSVCGFLDRPRQGSMYVHYRKS